MRSIRSPQQFAPNKPHVRCYQAPVVRRRQLQSRAQSSTKTDLAQLRQPVLVDLENTETPLYV